MSNFITNAELRMEAERLCDENEELKAENAKLWAAVEYLYGFAHICGVDSDDMRELGIEVPK